MLILGRKVGERVFVGRWMVVTLEDVQRDSVVVQVDDPVRNIHRRVRVWAYDEMGARLDYNVELFYVPQKRYSGVRLGFSAPKDVRIVREEVRVREELRTKRRRAVA